MAEVCCCGNQVSPEPAFRINVSPCRCKVKGAGPSATRKLVGLPDWVSERQVQQREKAGLPVVTDIEKASCTTWS